MQCDSANSISAESANTEHTSDSIKKIAAFDFDGTVISGQSGLLFSAYLLRRHLSSIATRTLKLRAVEHVAKLHLPQQRGRELAVKIYAVRKC